MKTVLRKNTWMGSALFNVSLEHGWGNGYVLIPEGHPLHGVEYDEIHVDVHGGLTYSNLVDDEMLEYWDELSPEDKGSWCVGFDTAHSGDDVYRWPKSAVEAETNRLRDQLMAYEERDDTYD